MPGYPSISEMLLFTRRTAATTASRNLRGAHRPPGGPGLIRRLQTSLQTHSHALRSAQQSGRTGGATRPCPGAEVTLEVVAVDDRRE